MPNNKSEQSINRSEKITSIIEEFINPKEEGIELSDQKTKLDKIFSTTVWGYREIILVIAIARLLNPKYKASEAFYECNPRALFEGPIRSALIKYKIPHRKSGPLNIAKATIGINSQWAAQRRPSDVALVTVQLVKEIDNYSQESLENFIKVFLARFLNESKRVRNIASPNEANSDAILLSDLSLSLINKAPDAGNTPQHICGFLLEQQHNGVDDITVSGHEDRASVTSTTSKKPGDILEKNNAGDLIAVYEITVKPFNLSRISESWEAVKDFCEISGKDIREVVVICRKEDASEVIDNLETKSYLLGKYTYEDIDYIFVDINDWIKSQITRLNIPARIRFFSQLENYILDPNTAEKVKIAWKDFFTEKAS